MPIHLLYHDVTPAGADDSSGFAGSGAARYKLTPDEFSRHLDRIADAVSAGPHSALWSTDSVDSTKTSWSITFDDGGVSFATTIADALEKRGWRGWFFIATDFIGRPAFCDRDQLRDLQRRGHVLGSHSCSHPERMSSCSWTQLCDEWSRSCDCLGEILGQPTLSASVPGGFYSHDVARAAARAGIKLLFNSEPTTHEFSVDGCQIAGRYNVYRGMTSADAASLIRSPLRRFRQSAFWNAKKVAKTFAGPTYKSLRNWMLHRAYSTQ
jgi:peptidoglycan/xylan/chitin deacetylase (PgdA/CDA1 family)